MSGDVWPRILLLALALILPLAALRRRELTGSRWLVMSAIWIGIFLTVAAVVAWIRG